LGLPSIRNHRTEGFVVVDVVDHNIVIAIVDTAAVDAVIDAAAVI